MTPAVQEYPTKPKRKSPPTRDIVERFMEKVEMEPNSGCWLWARAERSRYGSFVYKGKNHKLTDDEAREIAMRTRSIRADAETFGVSKTTVKKIRAGKRFF